MMALFDKERLVDLYGQEKKEEGLAEGLEKGLEKGSMNAKREMALKLAAENWTLTKIADILEINSVTVSHWLTENAH